ncbi:MAG TPA: hypothetical protein VGL38_00785 [bacterium]|jgi:hypothetical protein
MSVFSIVTARAQQSLYLRFWLFGFLAFWLLASPSFAQTTPDLQAVDSAFASAQYEKTELLALRILQGNSALTADQRAQLNLFMGYAAIMLGHDEDARTDFARALDAVPNLTLDPVQVSPKFRVLFDEVKTAHRTGRSSEESQLLQHPSLRTARLTNLLLPGSGQWQEGYPWRGAVVFGLQAATVAALIYEAGQMHDSREDYLAQTDPARVRSGYDRYNRDYRATWMTGIAASLVYLAAQADLVWLRPHIQTVRITLAPQPGGVALAIAW